MVEAEMGSPRQSKWQIFWGSVIAIFLEFCLAAVASLIAAWLEKYVGIEGLGFFIFLGLTSVIFIGLRGFIKTLQVDSEEQSQVVEFSLSAVLTDRIAGVLIAVWSQFILVMGLTATIWAVIFLIQNDFYPKSLAWKTVGFWAYLVVWILTLVPLRVAMELMGMQLGAAGKYLARAKVKQQWSRWKRAIEQEKRNNILQEERLQERMSLHCEDEVKEAMELYHLAHDVRLKIEDFTRYESIFDNDFGTDTGMSGGIGSRPTGSPNFESRDYSGFSQPPNTRKVVIRKYRLIW